MADLHPLKMANRPAGRVKHTPRSMVLLAVFIVFIAMAASARAEITPAMNIISPENITYPYLYRSSNDYNITLNLTVNTFYPFLDWIGYGFKGINYTFFSNHTLNDSWDLNNFRRGWDICAMNATGTPDYWWLSDGLDSGTISLYNSTFDEVEIYISTALSESHGIACNETDIWIANDLGLEPDILHYNITGDYIDNFTRPGPGGVYGMTTNGSDIWVADLTNVIYWVNLTGDVVASYPLSYQPESIATVNGSKFWITELTGRVHYTNSTMDDIESWPTSDIGITSNLRGIDTTNGYVFWLTEPITNQRVYQVEKELEGLNATLTATSGPNVVTSYASNTEGTMNSTNSSFNIETHAAEYNITFLDEMTNSSIDFSANKNGTLFVYCSDKTTEESITGPLYDYMINCSGDIGNLEYIKFTLFDPKGDHYRTLIPTFNTGNLTFYMINTTPADVTVNLVTYSVTDASLLYQSGIMHFKKIILTEGQKDIIDTIIGSDGKVYAYLIGGETYTLSVESADGTNSKTLGEYTTPDTTSISQPMTIIDITFIPTIYNFIGTDISWGFDMDTDAGRIYAFYNDSTGQTNSIQFWIFNITNVSARNLMYYDSVSSQSHHLFQWDYITNGNENDTYLGYLEIDHAIHGNITESRPIAKGGIFYSWLGNIGAWYHIISVFLIVFVASIFGAKSAPIGAVILAIIAAFLFYIEWLPSIIAGGVRLTDLLMISLIALAILAMFIVKRRRT